MGGRQMGKRLSWSWWFKYSCWSIGSAGDELMNCRPLWPIDINSCAPLFVARKLRLQVMSVRSFFQFFYLLFLQTERDHVGVDGAIFASSHMDSLWGIMVYERVIFYFFKSATGAWCIVVSSSMEKGNWERLFFKWRFTLQTQSYCNDLSDLYPINSRDQSCLAVEETPSVVKNHRG